jgi:hypothetical protein
MKKEERLKIFFSNNLRYHQEAVKKSSEINKYMIKNYFENELSKISGIVSRKTFEDCYRCYHRRQLQIFEELQEKNCSNQEELVSELNKLERWFMYIIEPGKGEEWLSRENFKLVNGFSYHCLQELRSFIVPLEEAKRSEIAFLIKKYLRRPRIVVKE